MFDAVTYDDVTARDDQWKARAAGQQVLNMPDDWSVLDLSIRKRAKLDQKILKSCQ